MASSLHEAVMAAGGVGVDVESVANEEDYDQLLASLTGPVALLPKPPVHPLEKTFNHVFTTALSDGEVAMVLPTDDGGCQAYSIDLESAKTLLGVIDHRGSLKARLKCSWEEIAEAIGEGTRVWDAEADLPVLTTTVRWATLPRFAIMRIFRHVQTNLGSTSQLLASAGIDVESLGTVDDVMHVFHRGLSVYLCKPEVIVVPKMTAGEGAAGKEKAAEGVAGEGGAVKGEGPVGQGEEGDDPVKAVEPSGEIGPAEGGEKEQDAWMISCRVVWGEQVLAARLAVLLGQRFEHNPDYVREGHIDMGALACAGRVCVASGPARLLKEAKEWAAGVGAESKFRAVTEQPRLRDCTGTEMPMPTDLEAFVAEFRRDMKLDSGGEGSESGGNGDSEGAVESTAPATDSEGKAGEAGRLAAESGQGREGPEGAGDTAEKEELPSISSPAPRRDCADKGASGGSGGDQSDTPGPAE